MGAGPIERLQKPGSTLPGFFIVIFLLVPCVTSSQPLTGLLDELVRDQGALLPLPPSADADTPGVEASVRAVYNDLYHYRLRDTGGSDEVIAETAVTNPRLDGAIAYTRKTWGGRIQGNAGAILSDWLDDPQGYDNTVRSPLNAGFISGWKTFDYFFVSGALGYNRGVPLAHTDEAHSSIGGKTLSFLNGSRVLFGLMAGISLPQLRMAVYKKKQPFLNILDRIEKRSNGSFVALPLTLSSRESGANAVFRSGLDSCEIDAARLSPTSDTGISGANVLPLQIDGSGFRVHIGIAAQSITWSPSLSFSSMVLGFKARGYTDNGSFFFDLDSNLLSHTRFEGTILPSGRFSAGIFAESAACDNRSHGAFDPYLLTSFSIFDPVKYRIDTLRFRYRTAGAFLKKTFAFFSRDRIDATIYSSIIVLDGRISTREYDFSFIIPRLINPRTMKLVDETRLLLTPEIRYSLVRRRYSCSVSARQLLPLDISSPGSGNRGGAATRSNRTSVRGGTTVSVSASCRW